MKIYPDKLYRVYPIVKSQKIRSKKFDADPLEVISEYRKMDIDKLKQEWEDDLHHNSDLWYLAKLREKMNHISLITV